MLVADILYHCTLDMQGALHCAEQKIKKKIKIKWKEGTDYKMDAVLILKMGTGNGAFRVCQRDKTEAHTRIYTSSEGDRGTG